MSMMGHIKYSVKTGFLRLIIGAVAGFFFSGIIATTILVSVYPSRADIPSSSITAAGVFIAVTMLLFMIISALSTRKCVLCVLLLLCSIPSLIFAFFVSDVSSLLALIVFFLILVLMTRVSWILLRKYFWRDITGRIVWFPIIKGFIEGFRKGWEKPDVAKNEFADTTIGKNKRFGRRSR